MIGCLPRKCHSFGGEVVQVQHEAYVVISIQSSSSIRYVIISKDKKKHEVHPAGFMPFFSGAPFSLSVSYCCSPLNFQFIVEE